MKKIKILLFLSIVFISKNVFADTTYDMTSRITSPVNFTECGNGSYTGVELNGATNCWNTNTRYQGTLSRIYFNLPAPSGNVFESDTAYRLSLYMATNDWRNRFGSVSVRPASNYTNNFVDTFTFVSMKQININFTVPYTGSTTFQTLYVDIPATSTSTLITGETNWNLSKVTLTKLTSGSGGGSTQPSGPSTSFDDTAIINNANENTQDIIDNNNNNTQDIINNANENTQTIDNSLNTQCKNGPIILSDEYYMKDNYYLDENGNEVADSSAAISTYFVIKPNSTYTISSPGGLAGNTYSICLYDSNKNILAASSSRKCQSVNEFTNGINSGPYAQYMRITIPKRWYANVAISGPICNNFTKESIDNASSAIGGAIQGGVSGIIDNQNSNTDRVTDSINDINDNLTDETAPDIDLDLDLDTSSPVSDLLTMPITILNKVFDITDDTCQPYVLPFDFFGGNNTLTLPCIDLRNYLGNSVYNVLDTILCFYLCYQIGMMCISIYEDITSLRDGFDSLYTPKHARPLGKHTKEVE